MTPEMKTKIFDFFNSLFLTRRDVAYLIDVTESYLSHISSGSRNSSKELTDRLTSLFCFLEELVLEKGMPDLSHRYSDINDTLGISREVKRRKQESLKEVKELFKKYCSGGR